MPEGERLAQNVEKRRRKLGLPLVQPRLDQLEVPVAQLPVDEAVQAESRAREAEKWLLRLHVEMEDKFTSWKGEQARRNGSTAAA